MKSVIVSLLGLWSLSVFSAPFTNLDFERAAPVVIPGNGLISTKTAIPGWHAWYGDQEQSMIEYKSLTLGSAGVRLGSFNPPDPTLGKFYVGVFSGGVEGLGFVSAGISQQGEIPSDARSLVFYTGSVFTSDNSIRYRVSINGSRVPLGPVDERTWGADISVFAGKSVDLRFDALPLLGDPVSPQSFLAIDNITFSSTPFSIVPEPDSYLLFALGLAAVVWVSRNHKNLNSIHGSSE